MIQYGLTSFGFAPGGKCALNKNAIPSVFTSISFHRHWIDEQIVKLSEPGSVAKDVEFCVKDCLKQEWNQEFVRNLNLDKSKMLSFLHS